MNKGAVILSIISFTIIILLLFTTTFLYMIKENEKEKRIGLQKQVDELMIKEQNFELKLKETEMVNAQMAASIKFQEEKISMLAKGFEDEKEARNKSAAKIQEKEFEIQTLKARIEEMKADKEDVLKSLDKLNEDYLNMKFNLENLIKTKDELEKRTKELAEKEGVSLGTVVIKQSNN